MSQHSAPAHLDRDVLHALLRQARTADADTAGDPAKAVDVFVDHLLPVLVPRLIPIAVSLAVEELERRGWRPAPTLAERIKPLTPNGERVLAWFTGGFAFAFVLTVVWLVVGQVTS
jgi:hypothetical protein